MIYYSLGHEYDADGWTMCPIRKRMHMKEKRFFLCIFSPLNWYSL